MNIQAIELSQKLLLLTSRAFYDQKESIVMDILIYNPYQREDLLGISIGLTPKQTQKTCARLKMQVSTGSDLGKSLKLNQGMIQSLSRMEDIPFSASYVHDPTKPARERRKINRTYYYIDYPTSINFIKYKIYKIQNHIDKQVTKSTMESPFKCPTCQTMYSSLDIQTLQFSPEMIPLCEYDSTELSLDANTEPTLTNTTYINFMNQVQPIVEILKKLDTLTFPLLELQLPDPVAKMPGEEEPTAEKELKVATIKTEVKQSVVIELEEDKEVDEDDEVKDYYANLAGASNADNATPQESVEEVVIVPQKREMDSSSDEEDFEEI